MGNASIIKRIGEALIVENLVQFVSGDLSMPGIEL